MRKNLAILTCVAALALVVHTTGVFAGGSNCSGGAAQAGVSKASSGAGCCAGDKAMKASAGGGACTMSGASANASCCPFDKAAFEKQAPGTTMDIQTTANGATLTITAANASYVAAVQMMAANGFETMKTQMAAAKAHCPTGASSSMKSGDCPAHPEMSKSSVTKASMSSDGACPATGKTASAGAGCCAGDKAGMKAEKASGACTMGASTSGMCETVMTGMCCSEPAFEKTSNGVRISWTSPKADIVKSVQTAAAHMKTCMATGTRL